MHNLKKILTALLALVMVFGLMACGDKDPVGNPEGTEPVAGEAGEVIETSVESIGSLDLVGISRLKLHYNAEGKVVAILNQDGSPAHTQLLDTSCDEAIVQILRDTEGSYAETFLLIRQASDTLVPYDSFLQDIVSKAQKEVGALPVILSSAADQNSQGYFSAETAIAVLSAYLGNPANTNYTVSSDLVDGYYTIEVHSSAVFEHYTVGALYGSVALQTETEDDFTDGITEEVVIEPEIQENASDGAPEGSEDTSADDDVPVETPTEDPTEEVIG